MKAGESQPPSSLTRARTAAGPQTTRCGHRTADRCTNTSTARCCQWSTPGRGRGEPQEGHRGTSAQATKHCLVIVGREWMQRWRQNRQQPPTIAVGTCAACCSTTGHLKEEGDHRLPGHHQCISSRRNTFVTPSRPYARPTQKQAATLRQGQSLDSAQKSSVISSGRQGARRSASLSVLATTP